MRGALLRPWALVVALLFASTACATSSSTDAAASPTAPSIASTAVANDSSSNAPTASTTDPLSPTTVVAPPIATDPAQGVVETGSDVLVESDFAHIDGKRVGLIAHQVSVVGGQHLGDLLHAAPNVELVAMFGPEHGVRGDADAGEYVADGIDPATGVPVYSLFGPTRQPTPDMLSGIDVLLYDLQDVGTRYYTYISTMGLAMQAAAEAEVEFVVLDRPNPLGGEADGGTLDPANASFVGFYPLPDVYGLTAGELARWAHAELLPGVTQLDLHVIELRGWTRSMQWQDTGIEWIAPSPALDTVEAALLYPATIYFEALTLSYGRGTEQPFRVIGAPWLDVDALIANLDARSLAGVGFEATMITPEMLPGMTVEPAYLDTTIPALALTVTDATAIRPTSVGLHLLDAVFAQATALGIDPLARPAWLDQLSGSTLLRRSFTDQPITVDELLALHRDIREADARQREQYLIYE